MGGRMAVSGQEGVLKPGVPPAPGPHNEPTPACAAPYWGFAQGLSLRGLQDLWGAHGPALQSHLVVYECVHALQCMQGALFTHTLLQLQRAGREGGAEDGARVALETCRGCVEEDGGLAPRIRRASLRSDQRDRFSWGTGGGPLH